MELGEFDRWKSVPAGGVLTDDDYANLIEDGDRFVTRDDGQRLEFEQAHLIVHVGDRVQKTFDKDPGTIIDLTKEDGIEIPPGGVVLVETSERFELPAFVQGQVSPRGRLTTVGLAFPTTHVDPGFTGPLYLPFVNSGKRTLRLQRGDSIGKVELQKLHAAVAKPWQGEKAKPAFAFPAVDLFRAGSEAEAEDVTIRRYQIWTAALVATPPAAIGYAVIAEWAIDHVADLLREAGVDWSAVSTEVLAGVLVVLVVAVLAYAGRVVVARWRRASDW